MKPAPATATPSARESSQEPPSCSREYKFPRGLAILVACKAVALALILAHHPAVAVVLFFAPDPWLFAQIAIPTTRGLGPIVTQFATARREVWLTIDDGPDPATTPRVLALLDAHGARATFFLVGEKAERHPELVAEIVRRGHSLANHTHTHPSTTFWAASPRRTEREIDAAATVLQRASGAPVRWFRPPVGIKNLFLHRALARRGLDLVLWSARGYDGLFSDAAAISKRIVRQLKPGAIVLLHESGPPSSPRVAVIEQVLQALPAAGFQAILPSPESLRHET